MRDGVEEASQPLGMALHVVAVRPAPDGPEPTDYWLADLPETTPLPVLARLAKIR